MEPGDIGLNVGKLSYWDMAELTLRHPPAEQLALLDEDLVQVELDPDTLLDIGWYGTGPGAAFRVVLIERQNWEDPVFRVRATTWTGLIAAVGAAIAVWRSQAVVAGLGSLEPGDLEWVERLEWTTGGSSVRSKLVLVGLFQRRALAAPTFRVGLAFYGVSNLCVRDFSGGGTQVLGFSIEDISNRGWENIRYRVTDYEDGKIEFDCAEVLVEFIKPAEPPP